MSTPWIVDYSSLYGKELKKAQQKNREYARKKVAEEYDEEVKELKDKIKNLKTIIQTGCKFCRGLPYGPYKLKFDCGRMYGLKIEGERVSCPDCNRIMAHWE